MPMIRPRMPCVDCSMEQSVSDAVHAMAPRSGRTMTRSTGIRKGRSEKTMTRVTDIPDPAQLVEWMSRLSEARDRAAFKALFAYFAPRIKAYMMRSGSDDTSAEEFAQEAMLMVWRKADSFDAAQASVATWVFTIARNKRIDAFRRANRPELDPDDPLLLPSAETMQDDKVAEDQAAASIRDAMADLPEEQVRMLKMAFYEDKAHSEIAEETGLPLGTVKSRLRLALGKLRGKLGETEL